jgi:hypothetical protein
LIVYGVIIILFLAPQMNVSKIVLLILDIDMLISSQIKVVISTILLIILGIIAYRKVISRYVEIV